LLEEGKKPLAGVVKKEIPPTSDKIKSISGKRKRKGNENFSEGGKEKIKSQQT